MLNNYNFINQENSTLSGRKLVRLTASSYAAGSAALVKVAVTHFVFTQTSTPNRWHKQNVLCFYDVIPITKRFNYVFLDSYHKIVDNSNNLIFLKNDCTFP